jgi:hypothetical protein
MTYHDDSESAGEHMMSFRLRNGTAAASLADSLKIPPGVYGSCDRVRDFQLSSSHIQFRQFRQDLALHASCGFHNGYSRVRVSPDVCVALR